MCPHSIPRSHSHMNSHALPRMEEGLIFSWELVPPPRGISTKLVPPPVTDITWALNGPNANIFELRIMSQGGVLATFWLATSLLHLDWMSVSFLIGWHKMDGHHEEFWQRVLACVCECVWPVYGRNNGGTNNEKSWVVYLRSQIVEFNSCVFWDQCCFLRDIIVVICLILAGLC